MKVLIDRDMIYVQRADGVRLGKQLTIATSGYELDLEDTFFKEADSFLKDYEIANNPPTPLDLAKKRLEELAMGKVEYPYSTKPEKYTKIDPLPLLKNMLDLEDTDALESINAKELELLSESEKEFQILFSEVFRNSKNKIKQVWEYTKEEAIAELQKQAKACEELAKKQELNWGKN